MTEICIDRVDPGGKGKIVSSETTRILNRLLKIDLHHIEDECNRIANRYREKWNNKNLNNHMIVKYLPNLTYREGIKELYPNFFLTAPSTIHIQIFDLYADTLNSISATNYDAAAGVLPHPTDPVLTIFLPTLQINGLTITWTHIPSTSFRSIIIHEFLHLCGEVKTPHRDIVDGVIRHTIVEREAIEPLICT